MKVKSKTTSDQTQIKSLLRRLKSLDSHCVEYGYYEEDKHPSGKSMAEVASIQEYGDEETGIPSRPFMTQAQEYSSQLMEIDSKWRGDLWKYLSGNGQIKTFLYKQAEDYGKESIQFVINRQHFEENAPWWRDYKSKTYGHTDILRATGTLYDNVKFKVKKE